jgi:benzil reductase ((S)-benzoin forming)
MYLKGLQLEEEIEVVSYDPGVVDTNMQALIRSTDKDKFQFVQKFEDYYKNGSLNSPQKVAEDIWKRYLIDWSAVEFTERYQK